MVVAFIADNLTKQTNERNVRKINEVTDKPTNRREEAEGIKSTITKVNMSTTQIGAITNRFCYLQDTNKTTLRQTRTHAKANSRPSPKDTNIFGCESTTS